jgi:bis(5'-nucleosidyl)-tetraphosphatase
MTKPIKQEFSAGGVVYKKTNQGLRFVLGRHSGYHKWVLPKGLIEKDETSQQTAIRETEEEMGVKTKLTDKNSIHKETYFYLADLKKTPGKSTRRVEKYQEEGGGKTKVKKTVSFYLLEHVSGDPEKDHGWEMSQAGWFDYDEALEKLAFEGERAALKKAQAKLTD